MNTYNYLTGTMGVVIACKDISIHLSYREFNFIKNYLLLLCMNYVKEHRNTDQPVEDEYLTDYIHILIRNNICGIPLLFKNTIFNSKESKQIVDDILVINENNLLPTNITNFGNLFLLSAVSNSYLFIK